MESERPLDSEPVWCAVQCAVQVPEHQRVGETLPAVRKRLANSGDGVIGVFDYRTNYDKVCISNRHVCGVRGQPRFPMLKDWGPSIMDNSWSGCRRRCQEDVRCQSFGIGALERCHLYRQPVAHNLDLSKLEVESYWDVGCEYVIDGDVGFERPFYTDKTFFKDEPAESIKPVTRTLAEYVPFMTDSPRFVATKAVAPFGGYANEAEFVKSHTYTQYELPTLASVGSLGVMPTAIPKVPWTRGGCMVSTGPWANFTLVNQDFVPVTWHRDDRLHRAFLTPLVQPHVPVPLWDPLGGRDPLAMPIDAFYLQVPPHGPDTPAVPAGVFDLMLSGSVPRMVAVRPDGEFVLVDSKLLSIAEQNLTTSIFRVDCEGHLTLEIGGVAHSWFLVSDIREPDNELSHNMLRTRLKAKPGNPDPDRNLFRAVSNGHWISQKARGDHAPINLADRLEGAAPKCPIIPGRLGISPVLLEQNTPGLGNLCTNKTFSWRPSPFNFTMACAAQSRCYDRCDRHSWETCNEVFVENAINYCFDHWANTAWDIVATLACTSKAKYLGIYLASQGGKELYARAQNAMCGCSCQATNTTATCMEPVPNGEWYCADVNINDAKNCGACGRTCGPGAVCRKGRCKCPGEQCGTTCVELKNSPFHCGRCGNICQSGYSTGVEGQCYVLGKNDTFINGAPGSLYPGGSANLPPAGSENRPHGNSSHKPPDDFGGRFPGDPGNVFPGGSANPPPAGSENKPPENSNNQPPGDFGGRFPGNDGNDLLGDSGHKDPEDSDNKPPEDSGNKPPVDAGSQAPDDSGYKAPGSIGDKTPWQADDNYTENPVYSPPSDSGNRFTGEAGNDFLEDSDKSPEDSDKSPEDSDKSPEDSDNKSPKHPGHKSPGEAGHKSPKHSGKTTPEDFGYKPPGGSGKTSPWQSYPEDGSSSNSGSRFPWDSENEPPSNSDKKSSDDSGHKFLDGPGNDVHGNPGNDVPGNPGANPPRDFGDPNKKSFGGSDNKIPNNPENRLSSGFEDKYARNFGDKSPRYTGKPRQYLPKDDADFGDPNKKSPKGSGNKIPGDPENRLSSGFEDKYAGNFGDKSSGYTGKPRHYLPGDDADFGDPNNKSPGGSGNKIPGDPENRLYSGFEDEYAGDFGDRSPGYTGESRDYIPGEDADFGKKSHRGSRTKPSKHSDKKSQKDSKKKPAKKPPKSHDNKSVKDPKSPHHEFSQKA
ncbi:hypothetical protein E4U21_007270 [Claviceps maximensis]|nr:hypothetical protein E4U21_007270 [Claviceps maximensis]